MKVLVLNNRYPSAKKPFVASYIKSIIDVLEKEGLDVRKVVGQRNSSSKWGQWIDLLLYRKMIKTSKAFQDVDVVFAHHFNMYWNALLTKVPANLPLVIHWHGSELFGSKRFRNIQSWSSNERFKSASHIAPSEYFKAQILLQFPDLNVHVVPSGGIDTEMFKPKAEKSNSEVLTIGFAGHLNRPKGSDYLLHLAKERRTLEEKSGKSIAFKAIRYGVKEPSVVEELENNGVEIVNAFPKSQMAEFYQSLDVLIFPTRRKSESLGLVPIEAMACGVPSICTNNFACPEYCIPGKSGELFELEDMDGFRESVLTVIQNLDSYTPRTVVEERYSMIKAGSDYASILKQATV